MTSTRGPDINEARDFLAETNDFLITTHVNHDADGVGACLALRGLLVGVGKRATVVLPDPPDPHLDFLPGWATLTQIDDSLVPLTHAVILDCPTLDRVGAVASHLTSNIRLLNIDHHPDNKSFGDVNVVSRGVSSTCELVYQFAHAGGLSIDVDIATQIYTGILFDTGGFRFSLTTPTTLEVAADLLRFGVAPDRIADQLFGNKSIGQIKQLGRAIDTLRLYGNGRVALMHLGVADMQSGKPDEVVNYGLAIKGVKAAVLLKEECTGKFRVSLRSREPVDVNRVAAKFGGGGHIRASGCRCGGDRRTVEGKILAEIGKQL